MEPTLNVNTKTFRISPEDLLKLLNVGCDRLFLRVEEHPLPGSYAQNFVLLIKAETDVRK